jgi:hypothetical protein
VVGDIAHAAGTTTTKARALNSTGIHRLRDSCLEVKRRLIATIGEWVMSVKAPIGTVCSQT